MATPFNEDEEENKPLSSELTPTPLADVSAAPAAEKIDYDALDKEFGVEPVSTQLEPPVKSEIDYDALDKEFGIKPKDEIDYDALDKEFGITTQSELAAIQKSGKNVSDLEKFLMDKKFMQSAITAFNGDEVDLKRETFMKDGSIVSTWTGPMLNQESDNFAGNIFNYVSETVNKLLDTRDYDPRFESKDPKTGKETEGNLFETFQKQTGVSDEELATAWKDLRAIYKPMDDKEDYRVLSNGTFRPNLSSEVWLDDEKAIKTIEESGANKEEVAKYKERYKEFQDLALKQQLLGFTAMSNDKGSDDANFWHNDSLVGKITDSPAAWAEKNGRMKDFGTKEFMKDYRKQVVDKLNFGDRFKIDLFLSEKKLEQQFTGLGGLLGSDVAQKRSVDIANETADVNLTKPDTGWVGTVTQETLPLLSQVLLTRGASSLATSALTRKMGTTAAAAAANKFVGMPAAVALSGMQSAGLAYSSALAEGDSEEVAREKGAKSGLSTGIITGIFQGLGAGGAEKLAAGAPKRMKELLAMGKAGNVRQLTWEFTKDVLKDTFGEGLEEGIDEFVQTFLTADENESVADAWNNALEAAKAGMIIGGFAGASTTALDKALTFTGLEKTREAMREQANISSLQSQPILASLPDGVDPNSFSPPTNIPEQTPEQAAAAAKPKEPVVLSSSVAQGGVTLSPEPNTNSFLPTLFGSPDNNKEFNEDFGDPDSFALEPVQGSPNLEVVTQKDGSSRITVDRVFNHDTGKFEPMSPELKARYKEQDGVSPRPKSIYQRFTKAEQTKAEPSKTETVKAESDKAPEAKSIVKAEVLTESPPKDNKPTLGGGGSPAITSVAPSTPIAERISKQERDDDGYNTEAGDAKVQQELESLPTGTTINDKLDRNWVKGEDGKWTTSEVKDGLKIDKSEDSASAVGILAGRKVSPPLNQNKINETKSQTKILEKADEKQNSKLEGKTEAIQQGEVLDPVIVQRKEEIDTRLSEIEKELGPREDRNPETGKIENRALTNEEFSLLKEYESLGKASPQETAQTTPKADDNLNLDDEGGESVDIFTSKEESKPEAGKPTKPNEVFNGVRVHDESDLNKIKQKEERVQTNEKGETTKTVSYFVDSHESETKGGGDNKNVTIGALPVGSLVVGKKDDGTVGSVFRVVQTTVLKNGAVRHHLAPVTLSQDKSINNDLIDATANTYAPNQEIWKKAQALAEFVRNFDPSTGKLEDSPELAKMVEELIKDHFSTLVNSSFTDAVVVFKASDSPMKLSIQNDQLSIIVDTQKWVNQIVKAQKITAGNFVETTQMIFDVSENMSFTALEELAHYQTAQLFPPGTKEGAELSSVVKEIIAASKSNPFAAKELLRSARWYDAKYKSMTDAEVLADLAKLSEKELYVIGHEILASLYSRIKTGKDPESIRKAANAYLGQLVKDKGKNPSERASLTRRMLALVKRYMEAIRDFFRAHESLDHLPPSFVKMLRNLEVAMEGEFTYDGQGAEQIAALESEIKGHEDKIAQIEQAKESKKETKTQNVVLTTRMSRISQDFSSLKTDDDYNQEIAEIQKQIRKAKAQIEKLEQGVPINIQDTIGIKRAALEQANDALDHVSAYAKDGYRFIESQKELKRQIQALRDQREDEELEALDMDATGKVVPHPDLSDAEKATIKPFIDAINENTKSEVALRSKLMAQDLARVLTWMNGNPLLKEVTGEGYNGETYTKVKKNSGGIEYQALKGVYDSFGGKFFNAVQAIRDKANSLNAQEVESIRQSAGALKAFVTDPKHLMVKAAGLYNKIDQLEASIAEAEGDTDILPLESQLKDAQNELNAFIQEQADERVSTSELDAAQKRFDALKDGREKLEAMKELDSVRARTSKTPTAIKLSQLLAVEEQAKQALSQKLSPEALELSRINNVSDLLRASETQPDAIIAAIRETLGKDEATKVLNAMAEAQMLRNATDRLQSFNDELNFMFLGGRVPNSVENTEFSRANSQVFSGSLVDFNVSKIALVGATEDGFELGQKDDEDFSAYTKIGGTEFDMARTKAAKTNLPVGERAAALANEVNAGVANSTRIFGVAPDGVTYDTEGRKLTPAAKGDIMLVNARDIAKSLFLDVHNSRLLGDKKVTAQLLETMGFSFEYSETKDGFKYFSKNQKPINLPSEFGFDTELDYDQRFGALLQSGKVDEVISAIAEFVANHSQPSQDGKRTNPVLNHSNGITPAGLAHHAVAPKLIEFMALTKGITIPVIENGVTVEKKFEDFLSDKSKKAYNKLFRGLEKDAIFTAQRKDSKQLMSNLNDKFWSLHKGAKVANAIFDKSMSLQKNSYETESSINAIQQQIPLDFKQMNSNAFKLQQIRRASRPSAQSKDTFITLGKPIRAARGLQMHAVLTAEQNNLVLKNSRRDLKGGVTREQFSKITSEISKWRDANSEGFTDAQMSQRQNVIRKIIERELGANHELGTDVGADFFNEATTYLTVDTDMDGSSPIAQLWDDVVEKNERGFGIVEITKFRERVLAERLNKWRTEMLMSLLNGNVDSVLNYISDPRFFSVTYDENGAPQPVYDTGAIDAAILAQLEDLRLEELEHGSVIDSDNKVYDDALRALASKFADNPAVSGAIELVLKNASDVQRNVVSDPIQLEASAFDADARTLVESLMLQIPNLVLIEGTASWEKASDGVPSMVFVPDAQAPALIMPFGAKQEVAPQDLRKAMADIILWNGVNGKADIQGAATQILNTLRNFEGDRASLLHEVALAEMAEINAENGGDEEINALVAKHAPAIVRMLQTESLREIDSIFGDNIGDAIPSAVMYDALMGRDIGNITNEHAAAIIVSALTNSSVQKALMYSIASEPDGPEVDQNKLASRGNLISPSLLPGFLQAYRNDLVASGDNAAQMSPEVGNDGFEAVAGEMSQKAAEDAQNGLSDEIPAYASPLSFLQSEWASKLLHNVLDELTPTYLTDKAYEAWKEREEGPFRSTSYANSKVFRAPTGLVGINKPAQLTKYEARQLLSALTPSQLADVLSSETYSKTVLPTDLMALSELQAEAVREKYKRIRIIEGKGHFSEDNLYNFGTFAYGNSIWSDNSNKEVFENSRVQKGMIAAAIADGATKVMNNFGNESLTLEADLNKINSARSANRVKWVYLINGNETTKEEFEEKRKLDVKGELKFETRTDLMHEKALYEEEVQVMKDAIEAEKEIALGLALRANGYALAAAEIDQLKSLINEDTDYRDLVKILKGGQNFTFDETTFENIPAHIKAAYSDKNDMLKAMSRSIMEDYLFGMEFMDESLSLTRKRGWETELDQSLFSSERRTEFSNKLDDINNQIEQIKDNRKMNDGMKAKKIASLLKNKAKVEESTLEFEKLYNNRMESLKASIKDIKVNMDWKVAFLREDMAKAEEELKDSPELLQDQLDKLSAAILKAEREAGAEIKELSRGFNGEDAYGIEQALRERGLDQFVELTKESDASRVARIARKYKQRLSTREALIQDYSNTAKSRLNAKFAATNLARYANELGSSPVAIEANYLGVSAESELAQQESDRISVLQALFNREMRHHNHVMSGLVKAVNKEFGNLLNVGDFVINSAYDAARTQAKTKTLLDALADPDKLRDLLTYKNARDAVEQASGFDFGRLLGSSKDLAPETAAMAGQPEGFNFSLGSNPRVKISKKASLEIQKVLSTWGTSKAQRRKIESILNIEIFPHEEFAKNVMDGITRKLETVIENTNLQGSELIEFVTTEAKNTANFKSLPTILQQNIILDTARSIANGTTDKLKAEIVDSLRRRVRSEMDYSRRRERVYAPRGAGESVLQYQGNLDSIEILRRNHAKRGEQWSKNYLSGRSEKFNDGLAGALDRMSEADMMEMGAKALTRIEGRKYVVKGTQIELKEPTNLSIRTASMDSEVDEDKATKREEKEQAVRLNATLRYEEVLKGDLFKGADASIAKSRGRFDVTTAMKEDLFERILGLERALEFENLGEMGVRSEIDEDGNITTSTSLRDQIQNALGDLGANSTPAQLNKVMKLHNTLEAELLSRRSLKDIAKGVVVRDSTTKAKLAYLLDHNPSVRRHFAGSLKAQKAVEDAIGLINHGSTGKLGRSRYEAIKRAYEERFNKQLNKMGSKRRYESAAYGMMYQQIFSYIAATSASRQTRAQSLLDMFDQAEDGYRQALNNKIPRNMQGLSPRAILQKLGRKGMEVYQYANEETYKLLEDRVLFDELKEFFTPFLTSMVEGGINPKTGEPMNLGDYAAFAKVQMLDRNPDAAEWADFLMEEMKHLKSALVAQAKMDGLTDNDIKMFENTPNIPFRWRVFNRKPSNIDEFPETSENLALSKAMFRQSPNRVPKFSEIHMLDIDGFGAPMQIINDAIYRLTMGTSYDAFEQFAGTSATSKKSKFLITKEGILHKNADSLSRQEDADAVRKASAIISNLGQNIIENDMFTNVSGSRGMAFVQKVTQIGAVPALLSGRQIWAQTVFGQLAYSFVRNGVLENRGFTRTYAKFVASFAAKNAKGFGRFLDKTIMRNEQAERKVSDYALAEKLSEFVKLNSPRVYLRKAEASDDFLTSSSQVKKAPSSIADGRISGKYSRVTSMVTDPISQATEGSLNLAGGALNLVMAKPESVLSMSIFAFEILKSVNKQRKNEGLSVITMNQLLDPEAAINITAAMKSQAELAVSDIMGTNDRSMKSDLLQPSKTAIGELFRGMAVTFANQSLHLAGNSAAGFSMVKHGDAETKWDGAKLITSSLLQNVMFKIVTYPTIVATVARMLYGDDKEEKEKFAKIAYGLEGDGSFLDSAGNPMRWLSLLIGGSSTPHGFKKGEYDEDAMNQDMAMLAANAVSESLVQLIPYAGTFGATTIGNATMSHITELMVYAPLEGQTMKFDKAGYVTEDENGIANGGAKADSLLDRSIYWTGYAWRNHVSRLSTFANGLNTAIEPAIRMSNVKEDLNLMDAALFYGSELPFLPREISNEAAKAVDNAYGAKIWHSSWDKQSKKRSLDF